MIVVTNSKGRLLAFLRASLAVIFRRDQPNTQNGNQLCLIYLLAASVEKRISFVISQWREASVERDSCHIGGDFGDGPLPQLTPALLNTCWSRRRRRYAQWIYRANPLTDTWLFASGLGVHTDKREIMQSTCFCIGTKQLNTVKSERWRAPWLVVRGRQFPGWRWRSAVESCLAEDALCAQPLRRFGSMGA